VFIYRYLNTKFQTLMLNRFSILIVNLGAFTDNHLFNYTY